MLKNNTINNYNIINLFNKCFKGISVVIFFSRLVRLPMELLVAKIVSIVTIFAIDGKTNNVIKSGITLIVLLVVFKILYSFLSIKLAKAQSKALHKCKVQLYHVFLSTSLCFLYSSDAGQIKEKLNDDFDIVAGKYTSVYVDFSISIITITIYYIFIARLSTITAVVLIMISLLQVIPPFAIKKFVKRNYDKTRDIEAKITNFILEGYRGFATIKLYQLKDWRLNKLDVYHKKYIKIGNASIYTATAENTLNEFVAMILKYGTYGILGLFVLFKITSLEVVVQAIALSSGLFVSVKTLFSVIPSFAVVKVAEKRLSEWFVERKQTALPSNDAQIDLVNVTQFFAEKEILKETTTSFAAHSICVIKGSNGIGKSTVFKLIVGLLPCEYGNLTVGNVNPTDFCDSVFPKALFYLPQEDITFDFTPYDLCKMIDGKLLPTFLEVSKRFNLTDRQINETKISDLSGGERKKVFLTLAFVINPGILLLDEPTNSLDEIGKIALVDLLQQRESGALIITHDQLFDSIADYIYRISNGRITYEKDE